MASDADPALVAAIQADLSKHAKTLATRHVETEMLQLAHETRDTIRIQIDRFIEREDVLSATLRAYLSHQEADATMKGMRAKALGTIWEAASGTILATYLDLAAEGTIPESPAQRGPPREDPVQEGTIPAQEGPLGSILPTPPVESAAIEPAPAILPGMVFGGEAEAGEMEVPGRQGPAEESEMGVPQIGATVDDPHTPNFPEPSGRSQSKRSTGKRDRVETNTTNPRPAKQSKLQSLAQHQDNDEPPTSSMTRGRSKRISMGQSNAVQGPPEPAPRNARTIHSWETEGEDFVFYSEFPEPGYYVVRCDLGGERDPVKFKIAPFEYDLGHPLQDRPAETHFNKSHACRGHDCSKPYTQEEIMAGFGYRVIDASTGRPVGYDWVVRSNYRLEQDRKRVMIKSEKRAERVMGSYPYAPIRYPARGPHDISQVPD